MFQSRPSLLAQPLIRLSAFKPSLGEDKIEFAGDKDREKSGGGEGGRGLCVRVSSQTRASLRELRGSSWQDGCFFSVVPVFPFHFCIMAPLPVGLNGLVRYCVRRKITDS